MRRTVGHIPRNLGGGTLLDGRLKIRNSIEAMIVCLIIYFITKILEFFLPYLLVVSIRLISWFLFGGITLLGVNGEPLSIYILNILNYSNTRTYVTLRPPIRDIEALPDEEKKTLADRLFTGKRRKHARKE